MQQPLISAHTRVHTAEDDSGRKPSCRMLRGDRQHALPRHRHLRQPCLAQPSVRMKQLYKRSRGGQLPSPPRGFTGHGGPATQPRRAAAAVVCKAEAAPGCSPSAVADQSGGLLAPQDA